MLHKLDPLGFGSDSDRVTDLAGVGSNHARLVGGWLVVKKQLDGNAAGQPDRLGHGRVAARLSKEFEGRRACILSQVILATLPFRQEHSIDTRFSSVLPLDNELVLKHYQISLTDLEAAYLVQLIGECRGENRGRLRIAPST